METLKFKVGDRVRVKSLEWYNENKNKEGLVKDKMTEISGIHFNESMSYFCGSILRIIDIDDDRYLYIMSGIVYYWQDWMLEDEVVTEEKQEVEQQKEEKRNKIVEASLQPITKEQAKKLLVGTKFFCILYRLRRFLKKFFKFISINIMYALDSLNEVLILLKRD